MQQTDDAEAANKKITEKLYAIIFEERAKLNLYPKSSEVYLHVPLASLLNTNCKFHSTLIN